MYGLKSYVERDIKNIINADFIILSSRWTKKDIESIKDILNYEILKEKKFIIVSNFVEFNLSKPWVTLIDEKIFSNKNFNFDKKNISLIQKEYFNMINKKFLFQNRILKNVALENNLKFINLNNLYCNFILRTCEFLTPNNKKIFFDQYHLTREGYKYLSSKFLDFEILKN